MSDITEMENPIFEEMNNQSQALMNSENKMEAQKNIQNLNSMNKQKENMNQKDNSGMNPVVEMKKMKMNNIQQTQNIMNNNNNILSNNNNKNKSNSTQKSDDVETNTNIINCEGRNTEKVASIENKICPLNFQLLLKMNFMMHRTIDEFIKDNPNFAGIIKQRLSANFDHDEKLDIAYNIITIKELSKNLIGILFDNNSLSIYKTNTFCKITEIKIDVPQREEISDYYVFNRKEIIINLLF